MRRSWIPISLSVLLLTGILLRSLTTAIAETTDGIFVDGADSTWRSNFTPSVGLNTNIPPSIVGQFMDSTLKHKLRNGPIALQTQLDKFALPVVSGYANAVAYEHLQIIPETLQIQIDKLISPVVADFANAVNYEHLRVIPADLQIHFNGMVAALETQFANSSYYSGLRYPTSMINDTVKPIVSNFSTQSTFTNIVLFWDTNEFAHCTTRYGSQSGNYTQASANTLYYQNHELALLNLSQDTTYFVQFTCTDQSGNTTTSSEFSFKVMVEHRVLLPLIQK